MTPFGQYCRQLRQNRNISLKELAEALAVSPAYLSSLERGKRGNPSEIIIEKICEYLSLSFEEVKLLRTYASMSVTRVKISECADPDLYCLIYLLANKPKSFTTLERNIIRLMIDKEYTQECCMKT